MTICGVGLSTIQVLCMGGGSTMQFLRIGHGTRGSGGNRYTASGNLSICLPCQSIVCICAMAHGGDPGPRWSLRAPGVSMFPPSLTDEFVARCVSGTP